MAVKFVYSDSEIQEITAKYAEGISLETLAADYNKSVPSVRMKLVKLGVYQKATKPTTTKTVSTITTTKKPASTSKSAMLEDFKRAHAMVGDAPW
jgi:hypothetical protein